MRKETVVVLVSGYPDEGFRRVTGHAFADLPSNVAWRERIAAAGLTPITYAPRDPAQDALAVIDQLEDKRIALWACSGNVPVALWLLIQRPQIERAALLYGYTFDADAAAAQFRFANPARSIDDLSKSTELLVVRAGRDEMPGLNDTLDRFVANALRANLPITLINLPEAPHAFDVADPAAEVIAQVIAFLAGGQ